MGKSVFAHIGTTNDLHPRAKVFNTLQEARDFARSQDPDNLKFILISLHLTKEDLGNQSWFRALDECMNVIPEPPVHDRQVNDRAAKIALLRTRLADFGRLPGGFAGEQTVPPSSDVIAQIGYLLFSWPDDLELPQVTASGEGEIGLTWFKGDDCFDAIVSPDGYLTWVSKVGDEFLEGDVLKLSSQSFDPLHVALAAFFK
jgi:hypothetical protein